MRSLLPCPRGFFGVLRRDFAFCGTEKRGVRFFTHASRRKNLKREAARGGWIFIPCPRMTLPGAVVGLPVGSAAVSPRPSVRVHTSAFPPGCPSPSFIRATFHALRGRIGESFPAPGRLRCYPARGVSADIRRIPAPPYKAFRPASRYRDYGRTGSACCSPSRKSRSVRQVRRRIRSSRSNGSRPLPGQRKTDSFHS